MFDAPVRGEPEGNASVGGHSSQRGESSLLPEILDIEPDRGSTAGNTVVELHGLHLDVTGIEVWFGGAPAQILRVEAETLSLLTPPNNAGWVDVRVVRHASMVEQLSAAYFYDPVPPGEAAPPGDGPDREAAVAAVLSQRDLDGDGIENADDPDVDGDGIPNGEDRDVDGDGVPNGMDSDADGDGLLYPFDDDDDGDGIADEDDPDADGDGELDADPADDGCGKTEAGTAKDAGKCDKPDSGAEAGAGDGGMDGAVQDAAADAAADAANDAATDAARDAASDAASVDSGRTDGGVSTDASSGTDGSAAPSDAGASSEGGGGDPGDPDPDSDPDDPDGPAAP